MDIKIQFGKKLKKLRLENKLSQEALAHAAELDRTYIPSIEKGERNVSITVIKKIADALNISVADLMNGL